MKRSYPSGSDKRKKRKDIDKYLATLPKMTNFFSAVVEDTDRNNNGVQTVQACTAAAAASSEVALNNVNQDEIEEDFTLLPPAVTGDSVNDVEELSSGGHFDTDDDHDGALVSQPPSLASNSHSPTLIKNILW